MLTINQVSHQYDDIPVLQDINLQVDAGDIICLLGESGSGKTTLLRVIAGLESTYSGEIIVGGHIIHDVPIHQRGFGLMFQDFALFPHMTVAQNVAFGLRMQGHSKKDQQQTVDEMLALVGLEGYQGRSVDALSGGQKQRVALARSIAPKPKLLMLDEPLGSLDAGLRERLVVELRQIIKTIGLTAVYVTHDQQEAFAIADQIAIMHNGHIAQYGTPEDVYQQPKSEFVAQFLGLNNIVSAEFLRQYVTLNDHSPRYLLHPDALIIDPDGQFNATVIERIFQGNNYRLKLQVHDIELDLTVQSSEEIPDKDHVVSLAINLDAIQPLHA